MEPPRQRVGIATLVAILLAALAAGLFVYSVPGYLTLTEDGISYLEGARGIAEGRGYVQQVRIFPDSSEQAITHFPPLVSLVIAAASRGSGDCEIGAWWLNLGCLMASVVLAFFIGWNGTRGSLAAGVLCALPFFAIRLFSGTMTLLLSEPLFYPLILAGLLGLVCYAREDRASYLALAAVSFGLAAIARYAGLVWCGAVPVFALWFSRDWRQRGWKAALWSGALAVLPTALVLLRNRLAGPSLMNRGFSMHLIGGDHLRHACRSVATWFFPYRFQTEKYGAVMAALILLLLLGLSIAGLRKRREDEHQPPDPALRAATIASLLALSYLAFVAATISFVHYNTALDNRILGPVFLLVLVALVFVTIRRPLGRAAIRCAGCAILFGYFAWQAGINAKVLRRTRTEIHGYRNPRHQTNPLFAKLAAAPPGTPIVSNDPHLLTYVLHRPVWDIPRPLDSQSLQANPRFQTDVTALTKATDQRGGYLLHFPNEGGSYSFGALHDVEVTRLSELPAADLPNHFHLGVVDRFEGAVLYSFQPAGLPKPTHE